MSERVGRVREAAQLRQVGTRLARPLIVIAILVPTLLFVYTLPHVIALRNFILFALLVFVAWSLASQRATLSTRDLRYPLLLIGLLQIWLLVVSVFLSPDVFASLREWSGQWFKSAIVFVVGIGAGRILTREVSGRSREISVAVLTTLPFAALALIHCVLAVKHYSPAVYSVEYFGPSGHRANITHAALLGLPFVLVDISERLFRGRPLLPGSWYMPAIGLVLFLGAILTSGTRNGIIVTVVVVGAWMLWGIHRLVLFGRSRTALIVSVTSGCVLAGVATFSVLADPRWDSFVETAEIAWQTEKNSGWYRFPEEPLPRLRDGRQVEESAFLRVSFLKEGVKMLLDHPWGTEVTRHAFRNLLAAKYGNVNVFHSHIGVIDFGLSAGLPGLVVWVLFLGSLTYLGWREYASRGNAMGLVLVIVVLSFFLRMFIDSTLREHILQQFMLVAGLLVAASLSVQEPPKDE